MVKSNADCDQLQQNIDSPHEWETLCLSTPQKCHIIHVTRKRKPILRVDTIKGQTLNTVDTATYLGVELSPDLTWNKYMEKVAAKTNRNLNFIRRTIATSSSEVNVVAYKDPGIPTDGIWCLHHSY